MQSDVVCPYCGNKIDFVGTRCKTWNIDHVIPRYVGRITNMPKCLLEQECNKVISHITCNKIKGDLVPTKEYIIAQYFTKEKKKELLDFYNEIAMYIDIFNYNFKYLYKYQKSRCHYCNDVCSIRDLHMCNCSISNGVLKYKQILACKPCLHKKGFKR